jgi:acetoin:2,6-dichlorophenolindophenol oxidoreductase subunit beta
MKGKRRAENVIANQACRSSFREGVSHASGLKVALPSGPYEAKGLIKTAIRDDSPVVIFEDKRMYQAKGPVPDGDYTIPFGVAEVKRVPAS